MTLTNQVGWLFDPSVKRVDNTIIESYLFFALRLHGDTYNRTELSQITREINKLFPMPVMLLFQHGGMLTLSVINRRLHKRDESRDVLEKVTLIKDIDSTNPHRAHIEILFDLSLKQLHKTHGVHNFVELHRAWEKTLDISELNKSFFREIANWYFWAAEHVTFPKNARDQSPDQENPNAISVIRLITRLIFVWFIKEKRLVPDELFSESDLRKILSTLELEESTYYKAILQNLFFATLNQEMNTPEKPDNRKFRGEGRQHYIITTLYRYKRYFLSPDDALRLFASIPFLNGGLFECLDKRDKDDPKRVLRIDGFSDRDDNELVVPNFLFFSDEQKVDLNKAYGTKSRRYDVRGLINILNRYKFTITENTPIEEEVALDPELLGKVFENLLAAYNPDTRATARKQTGSFYTPREVVNYMVDESLIAYLEAKFVDSYESQTTVTQATPPSQIDFVSQTAPVQTEFGAQSVQLSDEQKQEIRRKLRHLFDYNDERHQFDETETPRLIEAIDAVKILDPACGSGAFPMGILHKLVFILGKLDLHNAEWKQRQLDKVAKAMKAAKELDDSTFREDTLRDLERQIANINGAFKRNELNYGRKLYLIQNCIYGVDIQPIAVQIAKLRFFISLVVDQKIDVTRENRGIRPLPNLETKFVAADTLIAIDEQLPLRTPEIAAKERELEDVRRRHFTTRTERTKRKHRQRDEQLRTEISQSLRQSGLLDATADKLARWDPYDQNASANFFDLEWMFGIQGGIDVVIGNPPYVRQEQIKELKPTFKQKYDCYTGTADLYVYFFERAFQLLKAGGVLTYISSNKYFRSGYGKKLRHLLSRRATIHQLIDFGDAPVFTAIAYPSIIVSRKTQSRANQPRVFTWEPELPLKEFDTVFQANSFLMPQKALTDDGWQLMPPDVLNLLERIRKAGTLLGEYVKGRFYYGIKTGLNEAFVVDRETRDRLIAEHPSSAEILKPFLRGRDVKRWRIEKSDLYLCYIGWGLPIEKYPAIYAHLNNFARKLKARPEVKQGRVPWYALSRYASDYWQEFEKPKIVWRAVAEEARGFGYDTSCSLSADTTYFLPTSDLFFLGVLNSSLAGFILDGLCDRVQADYLRVKSIYMEQIPIPDAQLTQQALIAKFVDYILYLQGQPFSASKDLKHARDHLMVKFFEQVIDGMVYELYLTEDLHGAGKHFFKLLADENLPDVDQIKGDQTNALRAIFEKLFDKNHPVRKNLFFLDSLETIRIIEGKV